MKHSSANKEEKHEKLENNNVESPSSKNVAKHEQSEDNP